MAEETVATQTSTTIAPGIEVITPGANMFSDNAWSTDMPVVAQHPNAADGGSAAKPVDKPTEKPAEGDDEIVDELEYLEKQTGYKSWDEVKAIKTELEQLKAKPQTAAERKFANEKSKQLAEAWEAGETDKVYDFLHTERQLKKAAELSAADAIKLHLQQSNLHYKAADVEDVFKERYSMPKKPVQRASEETEEFQERMDEYTERVGMITRAIERDGIAAKQDLAKQITELVPPEIPKREQGNEGPSQEVLEGRRTFVENFVKSVPKELEGVKGFSTTFKDDVVEIPIAYEVTPEEAKVYKDKLEGFAKNNLDVNTLFSERWVNKDGTVNIKQVTEDLYLLDNHDKIFKKIATDTGMKRMEHHYKSTGNIKVDGKAPVAPAVKTEKDAQAENIDFLWKNT
jgi:hypothetical protein